MGKIQEGEIMCLALREAYGRALGRAYDKVPNGSRAIYPEVYGNSVSTKGGTTGTSACSLCGKHITVEMHFAKIEGVRDPDTNQPIKLYNTLGGGIYLTVSGQKCSQEEHQK